MFALENLRTTQNKICEAKIHVGLATLIFLFVLQKKSSCSLDCLPPRSVATFAPYICPTWRLYLGPNFFQPPLCFWSRSATDGKLIWRSKEQASLFFVFTSTPVVRFRWRLRPAWQDWAVPSDFHGLWTENNGLPSKLLGLKLISPTRRAVAVVCSCRSAGHHDAAAASPAMGAPLSSEFVWRLRS
jgi:hypothetical protein